MIERFYAHNFRCLENFTLDLAGRPSALLIGKNGSGKSTVLDGFRLFQRIGRGSGRVRDLISAGDFAHHRLDRPIRLRLELTNLGRRFRYEIAFEWPEGFREARILDESLTVDGVDVFRRDRSQVNLAGGQSFGLDGHVVGLTIISQRAGGEIYDLKSLLAAMMLIAPVTARMTGYAEEPSNELADDAANLGACLRQLLMQTPKAYATFDDEVKAVIPDFDSIQNVPRGERGTQLVVKFARDDQPGTLSVEFNALSSGEKCFFLAAYIVAANRTNAPVICFWDEPDNHLSLPEVGQFVLGLRKMANPSRGGQLIATTHHPETVRKFSGETTLVLARKSHLEPTVVRPLERFEYQGDLVHALIRDEILGGE